MKTIKNSVLGVLYILALKTVALSCVCIGPDNPKEALKYWSDTVFSGEVISLNKLKIDNFEVAVLTFKVESVWKGVSTKEIVVRDYMSGSDCTSANFKVGERYIIFANSKNERGEVLKDDQNQPFISVDTCSWTANLANPKVRKKILNKIGRGKTIK